MSDEATDAVVPDDESPAVGVVSGVVTLATFVAAFGLLALGWPYFWIAFPVGFGGVLPATVALVKWRASKSGTSETENALEALRERYARGEIGEAEFERRVEGLLETESVDDAETAYASGRPEREEPARPGRERERERT